MSSLTRSSGLVGVGCCGRHGTGEGQGRGAAKEARETKWYCQEGVKHGKSRTL